MVDDNSKTDQTEIELENPFLSPLEKKIMAATGVLYAVAPVRDDSGRVNMANISICTATAFARHGNVYSFVTAAHCVGQAGPTTKDLFPCDDPDYKFIRLMPCQWYICLNDLKEIQVMRPVELSAIGHEHYGHDFAVFEVILPHPIPTIPLALCDPRVGETVSNVAAPLDLGKQLSRGYVTAERPYGRKKFEKLAFFQLNAAPGSSGSAIVSHKQEAIIGILVKAISSETSMQIAGALPVSAFRKFLKKIDSGRYPYPAYEPMYFEMEAEDEKGE